MPRPHVHGYRFAKILVESVAQRHELWRIAQMPFAEHAGGVPARLEQLRQRHLLVADAELRFWRERAVNAEAIRITARQKRAARGRADRLGDVKIPEDRAL